MTERRENETMRIKIENDLAQTKQMIIDMIAMTKNQYDDMVKCLKKMILNLEKM